MCSIHAVVGYEECSGSGEFCRTSKNPPEPVRTLYSHPDKPTSGKTKMNWTGTSVLVKKIMCFFQVVAVFPCM